MVDKNNRPSLKLTESIEIFMLSNTSTNEIVKEKLQKVYKHARVFETSIAQNGVRLLSFEVYGSLSTRVSSVALHELFNEVIRVEGTVQFRSIDNTLFELDNLNTKTETTFSTFNIRNYNKNTLLK